MYDVAIIGSGVGGLTAAAILAKEGLRVIVLEQHRRIGGLLQSFGRGGESFPTGVHYIGSLAEGQILWRYLKYIGVIDKVELDELDPDGFEEYRFPDFIFRVPRGHEAFEARLLEHFPEEACAIRQFISDMKRTCNGFPLYNMRTSGVEQVSVRDLPPLGEYLEGLTQSTKLRGVLAAANGLYGVSPGECPLFVHFLTLDSFIRSAWQVKGGGQSLAEAFEGCLLEMGGEVRPSARVDKIVCENSAVTGVRLADGSLLPAKRVVYSGHPKHLFGLLPQRSLRPAYENRIMSLEETLTAFGVATILEGDGTGLESRVIHAFREWDVEAHYRQRLTDSTGKPGTVFCCATVSPSRRRTAVTILSAMPFDELSRWKTSRWGGRPREYAAMKESVATKLVEAARERIPELGGTLRIASTFTGLTFRDHTGTWEGSAYGVKKSMKQLRASRISPRTRIKNLFLAGQSTMLSGIVGTVIGSVATCCEMLGAEHLVGRIAKETQ